MQNSYKPFFEDKLQPISKTQSAFIAALKKPIESPSKSTEQRKAIENEMNSSQILSKDKQESRNFSIFKLIGRWFLDFIALILFAIGRSLVQASKETYNLLKKKEFKRASIYIFLALIESLLLTSYIWILVAMCVTQNGILYNWLACSFLIFCLFLLLVDYYSTISETFSDWRDNFLDPTHFEILGIGVLRQYYGYLNEENEAKPTKYRSSIDKSLGKKDINSEDFNKCVQMILEGLAIDDTYLNFSYFNDSLEKNDTCFRSKPEINQAFSEDMTFLHQNGKALLFSLNEESLNIEEKNRKKFSKYSKFFFFFAVILFKIVFPWYALESTNEETVESFPIFSIILFYFYMMTVLSPLLSHEDLKRRTYILDTLDKYISFRTEIIEEEEEEENSLENEIPQKKEEMVSSYMPSEKIPKIDVTCAISLQTWDTCRRVAVLMDQKKSEKYEIIFFFLGIYFFVLILILLQVLLDIYVFFSKESALNSDTILYIFIIDSLILLFLFFQRIYYGSNLNETFKKHKDSLDTLTSIFQDLIDLFDVYSESTLEIKNSVYRDIFERIKQKFESVRNVYDSFEKRKEGKKFLRNALIKISTTINKIKKRIEYDDTRYHHKFLGFLDSDFTLIVAEVSIVLIPVIPTIADKFNS